MPKSALTVHEECRIALGGLGVSNLFVVEQVYEQCCKQVLKNVEQCLVAWESILFAVEERKYICIG